jgi:hypothetical protein
MRFNEQQQASHGTAIKATAILGTMLLLYVALRLTADYLPSFAMAPCEYKDNLTFAAHGLEAVLLVAGIRSQIRVFLHPRYVLLMAALIFPTAALLLQYAERVRDATRQQQCAARPLTEAMKICKANPAHYRLEQSQCGYDVLTVVAPGTTDRAWSCLGRWAEHNGSVSLKVDESVYRSYRRLHSHQTDPSGPASFE